jgi:hypothetical protein
MTNQAANFCKISLSLSTTPKGKLRERGKTGEKFLSLSQQPLREN